MSQRNFPDAGPCSQGCGGEATEVVVTVNRDGWVLDVCRRCAVEMCDPIGVARSRGVRDQ